MNKIITLVLIMAFLCHNIVLACPKISNQYKSLQVNSAFDEDPRNNDTQDEMADEYHIRSGGKNPNNPNEGPQDGIYDKERLLKQPDVPCSVPGGERQIIQALLQVETNIISFLLSTEDGRAWLIYCLQKLFTIDPPFKFDQLFLLTIQDGAEQLFTRYFYQALSTIDPAKAGLIILHLLEICQTSISEQVSEGVLDPHITNLKQLLSKIASMWELHPTDTSYITVFFHAKLRDRGFLEQLNIYPGKDKDTCYLANEDIGPIIQISGDTPQNVFQIAIGRLSATHLGFYFPDDLIPYIEYLLSKREFFFPFKEEVSAEVQRRKSITKETSPDMDISVLGSLYGFVISQEERRRNLRDFIMECTDEYHRKGVEQASLLPEGIIVNHHDIRILLMPDLTRMGKWQMRSTPYRIIGFVEGENLYSLEEKDCKRIETYLSLLPASEIKLSLILHDYAILADRDVFLQLATSQRGEVYSGHDLALENEIAGIIASVDGPISIVDVGMGGGELLLKLTERFTKDKKIRFFGAEPDPKSLRLAKVRLPEYVKVSDAPAEDLSRADFAGDLEGTFKIAVVEGVIAFGVNEPSKGKEILEELLNMEFDRILITGNTPVNLNYEELEPILRDYGYQLERTLYPKNLFNHNTPKIMYVLSKLSRDTPSIRSTKATKGSTNDVSRKKAELKRRARYAYLTIGKGLDLERRRLVRRFSEMTSLADPLNFQQTECYIQVTKRCDFQCRHCQLVHRDPAKSLSLGQRHAMYKRIYAFIKEDPRFDYIAIGGGEPLQYATEDVSFLLGLSNLPVFLQTNASFAKDLDVTREILSRIYSIVKPKIDTVPGYEFRLAVSIDSFHQEQIPVANIANLIQVITEDFPDIGMIFRSIYEPDIDKQIDLLIEKLQSRGFKVNRSVEDKTTIRSKDRRPIEKPRVEKIILGKDNREYSFIIHRDFVNRVGYAELLSEEEYIRHYGPTEDFINGVDPKKYGFMPECLGIDEGGNVYLYDILWGNFSFGNVYEEDISDIILISKDDPLTYILEFNPYFLFRLTLEIEPDFKDRVKDYPYPYSIIYEILRSPARRLYLTKRLIQIFSEERDFGDGFLSGLGIPVDKNGLIAEYRRNIQEEKRGLVKKEEDDGTITEDIKNTKQLLDSLITAQLEDRIYEIEYDISRLSINQQELVKEYVEILKKRIGNPQNIRIRAFDGRRKFKDGDNRYIIKAICTTKDSRRIGEGEIEINVEGEIEEYQLRVIGMLNIALASVNIPDNLTQKELTMYRDLIDFIKTQYKSILGKELAVPDTTEGILQVIRRIVLDLPKSHKVSLEEIEEYNELAKQLLIAA